MAIPKYNLDALGSQEFENLCQSLVQQIVGPGAKVYGMGRDGSREVTFQGKAPYPSKEEQWDGAWIFQVKFHDVQKIGPKDARIRLLLELDDELSKITQKYKHPCDNFILITNVSLTPVFQKGTKDRIEDEIVPKYNRAIKHIHVWGAEEVCRFLDAYPNIRQTYAHLVLSSDIIARLLKLVEREETDLDELVELYCQGCFVHEQYAALDDAGDVEDERVVLQNIFVDLDVKPPTLPEDPEALERLPEWIKQAAEDNDRKSALSYLLDDSIPGLVLVGGPGEGKSTLGQYLAQIYRARIIGRLCELSDNVQDLEQCVARIPIRLLTREYAQWISSRKDSGSLFHYIAYQACQESGRNVNPEDIHTIARSCPILLILDGLDEVSEKKLRSRVLDNIDAFVHQIRAVLKGDLRVIATTRPYGYSQEFDPSSYLHLTLVKLSPEKASFYARRWIDTREPNPREAVRIQETFASCLRDKVVSVLTQTPLQVTILLVIIRARGMPPKQREELFERYIDIIYQREQKKRPELLRTEPSMIYGLHKYLAYVLHRRAEKDKTAALMDVSDFRERVKEYLIHCNPLLEEKELENKVNQVITEASQRLVLIESPQEGKVGFGLTTIREFFAAAHLVDTAKDTKQRNLRFAAIARSPYWRNVALFFAGRVGRTLPGEASNMIDVCREIDTERANRFLKKGAELVMEMVDDRVLREPLNEIGAIQYGVTMLDSERIDVEASEELVDKLMVISDIYKKRVVRPWLEDRLKTVIAQNIKSYADVYQELFGMQEPLHDALRRASRDDLQDVQLSALSQAIKNRIVEPWVVELLEELVKSELTDTVFCLSRHWPSLRFYVDFPLSLKARIAFAQALLQGCHMEAIRYLRRMSYSDVMNELSMIKPAENIKENSLLLWAAGQIGGLFYITAEQIFRTERPIDIILKRRQKPIDIVLPGIANPYVREMIGENADSIADFCETLSRENEPFTNFLVAAFKFLLEPEDPIKYLWLSKRLQECKENTRWILEELSPIHGRLPENEEKMHEYHRNLYTLCRTYKCEEEYRKDAIYLSEIFNRSSERVENHPHKLVTWVFYDCNSAIEQYLDQEILNEIKQWLTRRDLSKTALDSYLSSRSWVARVRGDLKLLELVLEVVEKELAAGQTVRVPWNISYKWRDAKKEPELAVASRLKRIFEEVLKNCSKSRDFDYKGLQVLYWLCLSAGILDENQMAEVYKIVCNIKHFPGYPYAELGYTSTSTLVNMLKSDNLEVVRLSAASLSYGSIFTSGEQPKHETWISEKLWELAKDKREIWRSIYIRGMAQSLLEWAEKRDELLEAIKEAKTDELQYAWRFVIENAGYSDDKDKGALFELLLSILESGDIFPKKIRVAAARRLNEMVYSSESAIFDEEALGLPLSQ